MTCHALREDQPSSHSRQPLFSALTEGRTQDAKMTEDHGSKRLKHTAADNEGGSNEISQLADVILAVWAYVRPSGIHHG